MTLMARRSTNRCGYRTTCRHGVHESHISDRRFAANTLGPQLSPPLVPRRTPRATALSGIQSGNHSGPVGSNRGQQPFVINQEVREQQPRQQGWLPAGGRVAVRCAMRLSPRSMAAVWLSGFEEEPEESGEVCLVEVFGRSIRSDNSAEVGVGIKAKNDPNLVDEFITPRLHLDVAEPHTYSVEWNGQSANFCVDDTTVHTSNRSPAYPLQVMLAVFDFPSWTDSSDHDHEPTLSVDWITSQSPQGD
jgi:Glycosyl hydrolases family 16